MTFSNGTSTPKIAYDYEVGINSSNTTDTMKIGLMYVSDYGYAASNSSWTTELFYYGNVVNNNWLYLGSVEWTITRRTDTSIHAFSVLVNGSALANISVIREYAIRPCFYLTSDVIYVGGTGTKSDPIKLN